MPRKSLFNFHLSPSHWYVCLALILLLILVPRPAMAQANGDVVVTVQNELGASLQGASFSFRTTNMGATQTAIDGGANDADGTANGTIVISAANMNTFGAQTCDQWTSSTVSKTGYVTGNVTISSAGGGGCGGPGFGTTRYRTTQANTGTSNTEFTVRVSANDQFNNAVSLATGNASFSGLTIVDPVSFNGGDAYLSASPAAPGALTLTRTGYLSATTTGNVTPSALTQTSVQFTAAGQGPDLMYNIKVTAQDELGNDLTLTNPTAGFAGLTLAGTARYSGGNAYLPADPAAPGKLTLSLSGYVNTTTAANVAPNATQVQTIAFKPTGGQGAGLPFTVFVRAWDELNSRKLNLTAANSGFNGGLVMNGSIRYLDSSAYIPLTTASVITLSQKGYIDTPTDAAITPLATKKDTVDFRPGAGHSGPGMPFSFRLRIKDASGQNLNGAHVDVLGAAEARVQDVNGDSIWISASPTGADSGYVYIPLEKTDDDNTTLTLRVQHASYLTDQGQHLLNELNSNFQIQRLLQMGAQLAAPTLRSPLVDEIVATLRPVLKWTRGAGADSFEVQLNTKKDFSAAGLDTVVTADSLPQPRDLIDKTVYYWRVRAKGMGGNTGPYGDVWSFQVNLDNIPPVVTLPAPAKDSLFIGKVAVAFKATDNDTVILREISIDGGTFVQTTTDSTYLWNTALYPDGTHSLQVRAKDRGNNIGYSVIIQVRLKNSPTVNLPAPNKDSLFTGAVSVAFTATSKDSIISREISIDGVTYITTTTDSSYIWNTSLLPDGVHSLLVRAKDRGNNIGYSPLVQVRIDNSPPALGVLTVRYTGSTALARKGGEVLVQVSAKDALAGMAKDSAVILRAPALDSAHRVVALHDDGQGGDISAGDGIFSAILPLITDSSQVAFSVRARDRLGHDTTVTGMFRLDLSAPTANLRSEPSPQKGTDERHGEVYADKVVLKGTVADAGGSGLASLQISIVNDSGSPVQTSPTQLPAQPGAFSLIVTLVPGNNHISLIARDSAGNADTVTAVLTFIDPKITVLVDKAGGRVFAPDSSGVILGPDALQGPMQVTLRKVPPSEEPKPGDTQLRLLGEPREFGPDKTVFRVPVTVRLSYTDADLDPNQDGHRDFDPQQLFIVFWDGQSWVKAGEPSIDTLHHLVSVSVNHFTLFDLAQSSAPAPTEIIAYWTHNPLTPDKGSVFSYALPAPGKVSLHILDLAGDMVREIIPKSSSRDKGQWSEVWRGDNVSGRFAGVGLYVYIFKYESDDHVYHKVIRLPIGLGK